MDASVLHFTFRLVAARSAHGRQCYHSPMSEVEDIQGKK
jgi:hypothetical protein